MMFGCVSAVAVFAAAFAIDLNDGFDSNPFDEGCIRVDEGVEPLSFTLNQKVLDGDVVVDCMMRFTATEDDSVPKLPDDAKFALWL